MRICSHANLKLADNYLDRVGYRLPTEEEWEYVCRAGTETRWHFGEAQELTPYYSWSVDISSARAHPVAQLKPNDLGLHDVHGNVWEWCLQYHGTGPTTVRQPPGAESPTTEDETDSQPRSSELISDDVLYPLRSGAFYSAPIANRFVYRIAKEPTYANIDAGFRIVRSAR